MPNLLGDLRQAEADNNQRFSAATVGGCLVCSALDQMDENVRIQVQAYISARTIGRDKLVAILQANGFTVTRRSLERHRNEGHST